MQDKIFDFFVTSKDKGTGVGLAVSKRVVERHGGTISASNGTLGGARFELALPIGMHDYQVRHA